MNKWWKYTKVNFSGWNSIMVWEQWLSFPGETIHFSPLFLKKIKKLTILQIVNSICYLTHRRSIFHHLSKLSSRKWKGIKSRCPKCHTTHIVWKSSKNVSFRFSILAFLTNFCLIKVGISGNTVFKNKLAKIEYFGHF